MFRVAPATLSFAVMFAFTGFARVQARTSCGTSFFMQIGTDKSPAARIGKSVARGDRSFKQCVE
jgi:hypothetical protein